MDSPRFIRIARRPVSPASAPVINWSPRNAACIFRATIFVSASLCMPCGVSGRCCSGWWPGRRRRKPSRWCCGKRDPMGPAVVFGMNSMFAVRHFLPETLAMTRERGFRVVVVAPQAESISGVETRHVPMKRDISLVSDLVALWKMWVMLRSIRPVVTDVSTPKMGLIGGVAAWLAGVPHRIYTLRGLRYETARGWKRVLLMVCEWAACKSAHRVICISRSVKKTAVRHGIVSAGKAVLLGDRASEGISLRPSSSTETIDLDFSEGTPVIGFVGRLT